MKSKPNNFNKRFKEFFPTREEWQEMMKHGQFRQATIHQTMGPNWKDIYWTPTDHLNIKDERKKQLCSRPTIYVKKEK